MATKAINRHAHQNEPLFVSVVERARSGSWGTHGKTVNHKAQLMGKRENTRIARNRKAISDQY